MVITIIGGGYLLFKSGKTGRVFLWEYLALFFSNFDMGFYGFKLDWLTEPLEYLRSLYYRYSGDYIFDPSIEKNENEYEYEYESKNHRRVAANYFANNIEIIFSIVAGVTYPNRKPGASQDSWYMICPNSKRYANGRWRPL